MWRSVLGLMFILTVMNLPVYSQVKHPGIQQVDLPGTGTTALGEKCTSTNQCNNSYCRKAISFSFCTDVHKDCGWSKTTGVSSGSTKMHDGNQYTCKYSGGEFKMVR